MEERAAVPPQPNEPLISGDPLSAGGEARQDKGDRREPRTSPVFGATAANTGGRGRASPARGRFSDSGAQCGAASRVGGGRTNASSRISTESHAPRSEPRSELAADRMSSPPRVAPTVSCPASRAMHARVCCSCGQLGHMKKQCPKRLRVTGLKGCDRPGRTASTQ